jgi:hypothetical protein
MRVNVDSSVFTDVRFRLLAKVMKISQYDAIGRCVAIWMGCYDRRSKCLSKCEADASADLDGFADALLEVGLASTSRTKDADKIVIHGVESRIKFLQAQSDKGRKGGRSKKQDSSNFENKQIDRSEANALAKATAKAQANDKAKAQAYSPALTLAPDLAPDLAQSLSPAPERERETRATPPAKSEAQTVWDYAGGVHSETRQAVNPSAPNWPALVSGLGASDLRDRIRECVDREPDRSKALKICTHAVDVCAARAKATRSMQYFTPARLFDAKSFWLSAEATVEDQAKSACKKTIANDVRYGRVEPLPPSAYGVTGEQEI